jgi:hypothetical protein
LRRHHRSVDRCLSSRGSCSRRQSAFAQRAFRAHHV